MIKIGSSLFSLMNPLHLYSYIEHMNKPKRALTIAGAASGGSAGIQADIKTLQELNVYSWSVITAIVGKHPETEKNIHLIDLEAIQAQFSTGLKQIGFDAIKTGMLFSKEIIDYISKTLKTYANIPLVVDPVMIGKLDSVLLAEDAIQSLIENLIPLATIITPNMPEASYLLNKRPLESVDDLINAAIDLHSLGAKYVLVKGGRLNGPAVDVFYNGQEVTLFEAPRIDTINTNGAGCSYAAAITGHLAKGLSVEESVLRAKEWITTAIHYSFSYSDIIGPTNHGAFNEKGAIYKIKTEKIKP